MGDQAHGQVAEEDLTSRCAGTWGEQCGRGSQSGGGGRDELGAGTDGGGQLCGPWTLLGISGVSFQQGT